MHMWAVASTQVALNMLDSVLIEQIDSFQLWIHGNVAGSLQWSPAPGVHALV